jgi:ATP-dependent helicase HrpA
MALKRGTVQRWEKRDLQSWDFQDLPAALTVGEVGGFPVKAYPGLQVEEGAVHLRLFRQLNDAVTATAQGVPQLAQRVMHREVVWVQKDLRDLRRCQLLYSTLGSFEELLDSAWDHVRGRLFPAVRWEGLQATFFTSYVGRARELMPGLTEELGRRLEDVLAKRQEALTCRLPLPNMRALVDALVPPRLLSVVPWDRLLHLPRYLKALLLRAERAAVNPAKDREKQARVAPYERALMELTKRPQLDPSSAASYRWLLEEYRVSVFAQELGALDKVSPRKLDQALESLR